MTIRHAGPGDEPGNVGLGFALHGGEELGLLHVESGALVRSSYHAREQVEELKARAAALG